MKKVKTYKVFNESLKDKIKGKSKEEIDNLVKGIGGFEKYIEFRLEWMNNPIVKSISDGSYKEWKDKIPNRELAFEFWVLKGESLRSELKEYTEEIGDQEVARVPMSRGKGNAGDLFTIRTIINH